MKICRLTSLRIGQDEWLDLIEGPAGAMPHSHERSSSLSSGLINTSEAVAHILHCTQYRMLPLSYMQGGDQIRVTQRLDKVPLTSVQFSTSAITHSKQRLPSAEGRSTSRRISFMSTPKSALWPLARIRIRSESPPNLLNKYCFSAIRGIS